MEHARWSAPRACEWYHSLPWIRGCNYVPSDCWNRIDQWQAYGFSEHLATMDREMKLASELGFNAIRVMVDLDVWCQDPDGLLERFEQYLETAWKYGIRTMVMWASDCTTPRGKQYVAHLGPQSGDWGYHGARKDSPHGSFPGTVGFNPLDDPETLESCCDMVRALISRYARDERILLWNLFNEIGNNNRGSKSLPYLERFFEISREIDPIHPLAADVFGNDETKQYAMEHSDVISFHNYGSFQEMVQEIDWLKEQTGRPLLCTEWLNRINHNNIHDIFPLLYLEEVGSFSWGLVAGLLQYYEPHETAWKLYEADPSINFDFTKWMHDLYRPNLRPYDPHETELIHHFCQLADARFAARKNRKATATQENLL